MSGNIDFLVPATLPNLNTLTGPMDRGYGAWTLDSRLQNGALLLVSGTIYLARVEIEVAMTIAGIDVILTAGGTTLTAGQSLLGLVSSAGTLLYTSADQSAVWTTSGVKSITGVATPVAPPFFWVAYLSVGTTPPSFARVSPVSTAAMNAGVSIAASMAAHLTAGGQTTLASFVPGAGTMTQDATQLWAGCKAA